ncbi:MAG: cell division protein FtsW, cell division protein FtsW [Candidatus Peregrinibacteria bacterium GW2011_GWC2_39_14]|nr:MAG: Cell division protein FtsW [Candidatus Peregrinibacteria bacterium GW2011_GWA2_38_36]KKR05206.1 MAG: cell division protein FtsW, cell division protein FtsW [Candidatus Peregrinibacteria bacterium GW2011_GWC2_39_14]
MKIGHKADTVLLITIGALLLFGLVMITSIGVPKSIQLSAPDILYPSCDDPNVDCYLLFKRHLWRLLIGVSAFLIFAKISYRFWRRISTGVFIALVALLVVVLIFGSSNNTFAKSWITIFYTSLQPTEFAKLAMILYFSRWLEDKKMELKTFKYGFLPFIVVMFLIVIPVMLQPDIGSVVIIVSIASIMYFLADTKVRHLAIGITAAIFVGLLLAVAVPHIRERFTTFMGAGEEVCSESSCWQTEQANIAVGSGGFFGKGLTQGIQKSYWLPQASDDFIFAASAEEMGFMRIIFIVIAYAVIGYRGFKIAARAPDTFSMLAASGITAWVVIQAFLNIAVNIGLFPVTGITLPFISYGGSSLVATLIGVGILVNISTYTTSNYAHSSHGWRHSGSHPAKYSNYRRG